jgi:hypothetical protein
MPLLCLKILTLCKRLVSRLNTVYWCCVDTKGNWIDSDIRKGTPTIKERNIVIGCFVLWLMLHIQLEREMSAQPVTLQ